MANTAPKVPLAESQESLAVVETKARALAELIKTSKHFIVFTGAGISTTAGIPDFRGTEGVWTLRAQGRERDIKSVNTLQAMPTPTHMALVELQNRGLLKHVISQNCDGLHRKSGILPDRISELHGNSNKESCKDCGKEYLRDFRAVSTYEKSIHDHRTGRKCALCGGVLLDSIINFGESLPAADLQRARTNAKKADLCLALGSSLTVTPANEIPETVGLKRDANLVICNFQDTPIDKLSAIRVHARTDDLMVRVMEYLELPIPHFILSRRLAVEIEAQGKSRQQLTVRGFDLDGTPSTFLQSVKIANSRRVARSEPFLIPLRDSVESGETLAIELEFMGHYGEPNLVINHAHSGSAPKIFYALQYNPQTGEWRTELQNDSP